MNARSLYQTWAPPDGPWSPWAKPVLFAHVHLAGNQPAVEMPEPQYPADALEPHGGAIIVELPGVESIAIGLELVRFGYRPVPLFNACPAEGFLGDEAPIEVVPVTNLLPMLIQGADRLNAAGLAIDSPPSFLLDANRLGGDKLFGPGCFDNRWVLFATDVPSANFLFHQRITTVQVIHRGAMADDLLDVLRDWNRQGISLLHLDLDQPGPPIPFVVPRTWRILLSRLTRRLWALTSLRHNPQGGYGGTVPEAESSGG
jgi:hypothetical protein